MKYLIVVILFVLVVGIFRTLTRTSGGRKSRGGDSSGDGSGTYLDQSSHAPSKHGQHHPHDGSSHGDGGGSDGGGGDGGGGGSD